MIRRIDLYLFRQIFTAFLFSGVAVALVVLFTQSFRLLSFVIDNSSTMLVFFKLMGLMIPTFLPLIIPLALGTAVLFIYYKIAIDSELVILRVSGLSPLRMAAPAFFTAFLVVAAGYGLTIWLTPAANRALVDIQYKARDDYSAFMIKPGAFNDLAEGLTFFARRRAGGGMEDILVHDVRVPSRPTTIMAQRGQVLLKEGSPQIVVFDGRRQELDIKTGRIQELGFERYLLDLQLLKHGRPDRAMDPREMSFSRLLTALEERGTSPHKEGKLRAELHQRLAGPLLALSFAVIAVTVILAGDFNRRGMTRRVVLAGSAIVVVQALMLALVSQISKQAWLAPVLYGVVLAPLPACLLFLDAKNTFLFRIKSLLRRDGRGA